MLRPILYDFRKTFLSKGSIIVIILVALIGFALIPMVKTSMTSVYVEPLKFQGIVIYGNKSLGIKAYVFNGYGEPLTNVHMYLETENMYTGETYYNMSLNPDENGFIDASIDISNIPNPRDTLLNITVSYESISFSTKRQIIPPWLGNRSIDQLSTPIEYIKDPKNSTRTLIRIFYASGDGGPPTGYKVHYYLYKLGNPYEFDYFYNNTHVVLSGLGGKKRLVLKASELPTATTLTDYVTDLDPYPLLKENVNATNILLVITDSNENILNVFNIDTRTFMPFLPGVNIKDIISGFVLGVLGGFIPILAILNAYFGYGSDRVKGYIEMVLARPVTRLGIALSRYISIILSLAVAILILAGIMDFSIYYTLSETIPLDVLTSMILAFLVEAAALVGIILTLSHVLRSTGSLIGVGIGIWIVLSFFWDLIIFLASNAIGIPPMSAEYHRISIYLSYLNPVKYPSLVDIYRRGYVIGATGKIPITPAYYGITLPTLVILAAAWITVPLAIFLYLATKKD